MKSIDIFVRFLLLGLTSFGGPAAHIGYFRRRFVDELEWLDEDRFARLISLTQFLPGPGSSQLGFGIGLDRAGIPGALAAFAGFTLPSVLLMTGAALGASRLFGSDVVDAAIHGLKLLAVVVVADAALSMYQSFCQRKVAAAVTGLAAIVLIVSSGILIQLAVLLAAALVGTFWLAPAEDGETALTRPRSMPLVIFMAMLLTASVVPLMASDFFIAGSLVFGGGHVVLPLLEELVAAELGQDAFLTGYALAQAVPGPMFTIASYLGVLLSPEMPLAGAAIATAMIFLPGFLLMFAFQESWLRLSGAGPLAGAAAGINAAVVGLLVAALYDPVIVSAVTSETDVAIVIAGFIALRGLRLNVAVVVILMAMLGIGASLI